MPELKEINDIGAMRLIEKVCEGIISDYREACSATKSGRFTIGFLKHYEDVNILSDNFDFWTMAVTEPKGVIRKWRQYYGLPQRKV